MDDIQKILLYFINKNDLSKSIFITYIFFK